MAFYPITVVLTFYGYNLADALYTLNTNYSRLRISAMSYVENKEEVDNMTRALKKATLHQFKTQYVGQIEGFRVHYFF